MKVLPFEIPKNPISNLIYQEDEGEIFYDKLHQHKEIQISYIASGQGTLAIGDAICSYSAGDLIIIGSNLPHVFKSNTDTNDQSAMQSVFFNRDSFGNSFFDLTELSSITPFFLDSQFGFKVPDHDQQYEALFSRIKNGNNFYRFQMFLELLYLISIDARQLLSNKVYTKPLRADDGLRMQKIIDFTISNFKEDIKLEQIANIASMTTNAFCKYFKRKTNKSYLEYINELRIENACNLLLKGGITIAEISSASGFNSPSYFNRVFRKQKHMTPKEYLRYHNLV